MSSALTMGDGPSKAKPSLIITIDTEGDNAWSRPRKVTTHNAAYLSRFQELCESYGFKPTYLTNHEMAICPTFQKLGRDVLRRGTAEIGMHLHAWDSPPLVPLTSNDLACHPYLIEYPEDVMRAKVDHMTNLLEATFDTEITSHRAGRWSFNEVYAQILADSGYLVDCSVSPHVSWKNNMGDPARHGGTDYSRFPEHPYLLDLSDISRHGDSSLMEVPVTVCSFGSVPVNTIRNRFKKGSLPRRALNRLWPEAAWLRPNGKNLATLTKILKLVVHQKHDCAEFMLHSSELMPGGSPYFPKERSIEVLYDELEALFKFASSMYRGATLTEYYRHSYPRLARTQGIAT